MQVLVHDPWQAAHPPGPSKTTFPRAIMAVVTPGGRDSGMGLSCAPSTEGEGSEFHVVLPRRLYSAAPDDGSFVGAGLAGEANHFGG